MTPRGDDQAGTPQQPRAAGELRITNGAQAGTSVALGARTVLGRDDSADIVLSDASDQISRRHAQIRVRDGETLIEDLGSTNGTKVNDKPIQGAVVLRDGDRITIGPTSLEFRAAAPAAPLAQPERTRARGVVPADAAAPAAGARDETGSTGSPPPEGPDPTAAAAAPPARDATGVHDRSAPLIDVQRTAARPVARLSAGDGTLRILSGPGEGRVAPIHGSATIGREPECDLQVLDSEVSRRHAKVTISGDGASIDDLRSANGTYVNGERILASYSLRPGDRVEIGQATIDVSAAVLDSLQARAPHFEVTGVGQVIAQPVKLLTGESSARKWWTLTAVCLTTFMLLLDLTIVSVALPSISHDLKPTFSQLQWVVDAYSLMLAATLLTAGSMADIFGRRRVLIIGQIIFLVASVACGLAPTAVVLDITRGVQGIGGALMFACSLALIVQEFPAHERGIAFGVYGATNSLSVAVGPLLGGILTQAFGWQSIFYVNVPVGLAALYIINRKLVNLPGPRKSIDWGGLVTFSTGLFLLVYGIIGGNTYGWTSTRTLGIFAASILLLLSFGLIEWRGKDPMFDLSLLKTPTFDGAAAVAFTLSASLIALIFFITTWLQSILGYSPIQAGLRMMPLTLVALIVAPMAGRAVGKIHPRLPLGLGLGIIALGILLMHEIKPSSTWVVLLPGLLLAGIGMGAVNPQLGATAVAVVPPWRSGMASGVNSTFRELGVTSGIAALGAILQHQVRTQVNSALIHTPLAHKSAEVANAITVGGTPQLLLRTPASARAEVYHLARVSYAVGLQHIFLVAAIIAAAGCVAGLTLVRLKDIVNAGAHGGH